MVKNSMMMINAFPPKSGINDYSLPRDIAIGKNIGLGVVCCILAKLENKYKLLSQTGKANYATVLISLISLAMDQTKMKSFAYPFTVYLI